MRPVSYYATNDSVIDALVADPRYDVRPDGTVWRLSSGKWKQTGNAVTVKNGMRYRHLKYKGSNLLVHRIVFRKFHGPLAEDLVINHKDANSLNNVPSNLELVTRCENSLAIHY